MSQSLLFLPDHSVPMDVSMCRIIWLSSRLLSEWPAQASAVLMMRHGRRKQRCNTAQWCRAQALITIKAPPPASPASTAFISTFPHNCRAEKLDSSWIVLENICEKLLSIFSHWKLLKYTMTGENATLDDLQEELKAAEKVLQISTFKHINNVPFFRVQKIPQHFQKSY